MLPARSQLGAEMDPLAERGHHFTDQAANLVR
jgi:hypothetical protein